MKIIGIAGTNGSGKDTIMKLLSDKYGYLFASSTEMFLGELKSRGWPNDREHKSKLSAMWRRELGMGAIVDKAKAMAEKASKTDFVVGSLRHPGEADRVHELGGTMIWVDADPKIRYERIQKNLHERTGTHVEANKTFDEFLAEEKREMTPSVDEATLNMNAVKERCDIFLQNDGTEEEFIERAKKALRL